mmetsp:Transcript_47489/g.121216  ORF Transcript_47489/g.121216 Transcript_47489/m.121216 type:complete len:620 (+) Transcript_47489:11-1870(+)
MPSGAARRMASAAAARRAKSTIKWTAADFARAGLLLLLVAAAVAAVLLTWLLPAQPSTLSRAGAEPGQAASSANETDRGQKLAAYRQAVERKPRDAMAWVKLALALHDMDHSARGGRQLALEAVQAYSTALELGLADVLAVGIYANLGVLLMASGHPAKAVTAQDAGIELVSRAGLDAWQAAGHYHNRGKALRQLGQLPAAEGSFAAAVQAARGHDPHAYALACSNLQSPDESLLEEMEAAVVYLAGDSDKPGSEGGALPAKERRKWAQPAGDALLWLDGMKQHDRASLHFALYAAHNKKGDLPRAWEHLARGNRLHRGAAQGYSMEGEMERLQALMHFFRGSFARGGSPDRTPIFVVGVPRSGATAVEQILASHSKVWRAGEDSYLHRLIVEMEMAQDANGLDLDAPAAWMRAYGERYVQELRQRLPDGHQHAERVVVKEPEDMWSVGHIHMLLPNACIIHAVRHPLDTALSCYEQPFEGRGPPWAWDLGQIGEYILMNHAMARHWDSVLPGKLLTVMYEELVGNQEAVSRRILAHCGLEWEPGLLEQNAVHSSSVFRHRRFASYMEPLRPLLGPMVEQYEHSLAAAISAPWRQTGEEDLCTEGTWDEDGDEAHPDEL